MKAFIVSDIKTFMNSMLNGKLFHRWQLRTMELGLISHISIDGKLNRNFLSEEESASRTSDYIEWDEIQPKIKGLIQGKNSPSVLTMTLSLPPELVPGIQSDAIESYQLNIRYEVPAGSEDKKKRLVLITGISTKTFTMDKEPERAWDSLIPSYFEKRQLSIEELT
ncbi:MAG: hypothetical protein J6P72_05140 [Firmicutes bacterium]|nr:hypothetical protein [Bacillota bacterium]